MNTKTIEVAKEFSPCPAGRVVADGPFPGETFRDSFLLPAINSYEKVIVDMNGTESCGSSFLEEAFGGLVRKGLSEATLRKKMIIQSQRASDSVRIWNYISEASR